MSRRIRIAVFVLIIALALWLDPIWAVAPVALFKPVFASSCTIFSDDFSTDQTGTAYSVSSGSWSVSGGVLTTGSASALIVANTGYGAGATGVHVTANINCATSSDKGRIVFLYVDDSNYWYAEIQPGASNGTLKLFERSGGTDTQRGSTATLSGYTSGTLFVCVSAGNNIVTASVTLMSSGTTFYSASPSVANTKCGLGTGSGSSAVTFDAFTVLTHHNDDDDCSHCNIPGCTYCVSEVQSLSVTLAGFADGSCTCTGLTGINGTYVIARTSSLACQGSTGPFFCGGFNTIRWTFLDSGSGTTLLRIFIELSNGITAQQLTFEQDLGVSPAECEGSFSPSLVSNTATGICTGTPTVTAAT